MTTGADRPRIHFTPRAGWINDPLGLTWRENEYHLFFQYVPGRTEWDPACQWGHATSPDLLSWTESSPALVPAPGRGCWSGTLVVPPGQPARIFYTDVAADDFDIGTIGSAEATASTWNSWTFTGEVARLPPGEDVLVFRDPYVFHDGKTWRMLVGSGRTDGTALAYGYRSDDLDTWSYTGAAASRPASDSAQVWTGEVWECPQLFRAGDRWVLTFSVWRPVEQYYQAYAVGDYEDGVFTARSWHRLAYGPCYYAGSVFRDDADMCGIIYWLRGVADPDNGWAGAHSVPHRLELQGDRLSASPTPELLRRRSQPTTIHAGESARVPPVADLEWRVAGEGRRSAIWLGSLQVELNDGLLEVSHGAAAWECPATGDTIRIVLDRGVLEFFAGHAVLAVYVDPAEAEVISVQAGSVTVHGID